MKTTQQFIIEANKIHNFKYDYSSTVYTGSQKKLKIICYEHGEFLQLANNHLCGKGCLKCSCIIPYTTEKFIQLSNEIHNDKYNYSLTIYTGVRNKIIICRNNHGNFMQRPDSHLNGNGCPKCKGDKIKKQKTKTLTTFIAAANKIHNQLYNYCESQYERCDKNIKIICNISNHKHFFQTPNRHLAGAGCPKCLIEKERETFKKQFIDMANHKHNYIYDYSLISYINAHLKVKISCNIHGIFYQSPLSHIKGSGCPTCGKLKQITNHKLTTDEFILKANKKHKYVYNYSKSNYINCRDKICIICVKHGDFFQSPTDHLSGYGCFSCGKGTSKKEIAWLNYLNIPNEFRNKSIIIDGNLIKPDAIDIKNKIIYEFYGDYWHGNPQKYNLEDINSATKTTFKKLYEKTLQKENLINIAGYKLVSIWEYEWNKIISKLDY